LAICFREQTVSELGEVRNRNLRTPGSGDHGLFHYMKNLHQGAEAACKRRRVTECVF
jgi:hypothetical protein